MHFAKLSQVLSAPADLRVHAVVMLATTLLVHAPGSVRGELLYVSSDANVIATYDLSLTTATAIQNSEQTFVNSNVAAPQGLARDSAGNLYAANFADDTVRRFGPTGNLLATISGNMNVPMGLAIDAAGNIYSTNNTNSVSKFDSTGVFQATVSGSMSNPYGLAFDTAGNL